MSYTFFIQKRKRLQISHANQFFCEVYQTWVTLPKLNGDYIYRQKLFTYRIISAFSRFFDALMINVYRRINWYDCYIRIKHYANFRVFWTKRVVVKIIFIELLLVLFLAIMLTTDFLLGKEGIGISVYCVIGGLIFSAIISLQVITVQQSNAVHNELIVLASQRTNQKITKFCRSSTDHFSSIYVRFMQHRSGSIE